MEETGWEPESSEEAEEAEDELDKFVLAAEARVPGKTYKCVALQSVSMY